MSATLPATDTVTVTIDDIAVQVPKGTLLVEAAKTIQRDIPVYCYHEKLGPAGLCRVCLVEIEGMPKLQIACNTVVTDGMKVHTTNGKVNEGRRAILEFFLLNHPLDCPICDKGGECDLQDYAVAYGQGASRSVDAKSSKPKAVDLGPTIVLDEERCIVCQRCVRFDDIITQETSLRTQDRGVHTIIATASGAPYVSDFSGNVTEICPVGALTSKTYRFKSRPWDNHRTKTSCMQCSVGCAMNVDARLNLIARTMSDPQDRVSDGWLCDRGRYNIGFVTDERRVTQPLLKTEDGSFAQIAWDDAIALWAQKLKAAGGRAGVIGGGRLLNEEAFLAQHLFRAAGIENLDHRAGRQTVVHHDSFATYEELENAKTIVTVGRPPSQLAPILDLRIRKAVSRHGAKLISIGDYAAGSFVPETRATTVAEVTAALADAATPIAIVWDGAMYDGAMPLLHPVLAAHPDALRYVIPEDANGRGADAMGLRPKAGALATRAMLEAARDGGIDVLTILGANVMLRFPDRALAEAGIRGAKFVVATDLFLTETAALADLVLPVCSAFEKSGTTTDLCGEILPVNAAVAAPDNVPADGDLLVMLADALGIALPTVDALERSVHEAVRSKGLPPDVAPNPNPPSVGDGLKLIREAAIFAGGGTLAFNEAIAHLRTAQRATVNPATARKLGLAEGAKVRISAPGSAMVANVPLLVSTRVPEGAVALVDGLGAAPLNLLGETASVTIAMEN